MWGVKKSGLDKFVGKKGIVVADLKPQGIIEVDGTRQQAQLVAGYAQKGETVEIFHHEGGRLYCKKAN